MSSTFWNDRYSSHDLVYGEAPNDFLAGVADKFPKRGYALDIGAGEGRNALFLASRGLDVLAIDQSEIGMQKARRRAKDRALKLRTQVVDLEHFDAEPNSLDVISSIFVHLPTPLRDTLHKRLTTWLRPGGIYVLELYAPDQIPRTTGGPKDPELFAPLETIVAELSSLKIEHQAALLRPVIEGPFHSGEASVLQVLAWKG